MSLSRGERGIDPEEHKADCPACDGEVVGRDCTECEWSVPPQHFDSNDVQGYVEWRCRHCGASGTSRSCPIPCESCLVERGLMDDDESTADLYTSA
jgi:hypothetical protein